MFLAGYTSLYKRYAIDIYIQRTTKLFTPIIKFFVVMIVLIQNERTQWCTERTLCRAFVQGIVRDGYSPLFFYYELLLILMAKNVYLIESVIKIITKKNVFALY